MSMKKTYSSPLGICNIIFSVAVILLTVKLFPEAGSFLRAVLLLLCLAFPVIQPLGIFMRARLLADSVPEDLTIETRKSGLLVKAGELCELVGYNKIKKVISTGDCVILNVGGQKGYFLFNRVMGDKKEAFTEYIKSQMV